MEDIPGKKKSRIKCERCRKMTERLKCHPTNFKSERKLNIIKNNIQYLFFGIQ
jgi:hypothetical protein